MRRAPPDTASARPLRSRSGSRRNTCCSTRTGSICRSRGDVPRGGTRRRVRRLSLLRALPVGGRGAHAGLRGRAPARCASCDGFASTSPGRPPTSACASPPPERIRSRSSSTQHVTHRPRYAELIEQLQYPARRELIFGLHVHVGTALARCRDARARRMRPHLAELVALSASSPFWRGDMTRPRVDAARRVLDVPSLRIPPPRFDDYAQFELVASAFESRRLRARLHRLWWDLRPHPRLGTLEVRVMDAVPRIDDALALVAYVQALAKFPLDEGDGARHTRARPRIEVAGGAARPRRTRLRTDRLRARSRCRRAHARADPRRTPRISAAPRI